MKEIKSKLAERFDIKDLGKLRNFLGMKIVQKPDGAVWIGQPGYTEKLLESFGMDQAKVNATPVETNNKLVKASDDEEMYDQQKYQSAVGSLLYLSVATRPDITYAVNNVEKFCAHPTVKHWTAVKRIMRYLRGTTNFGIEYVCQSEKRCIGYSDSD